MIGNTIQCTRIAQCNSCNAIDLLLKEQLVFKTTCLCNPDGIPSELLNSLESPLDRVWVTTFMQAVIYVLDIEAYIGHIPKVYCIYVLEQFHGNLWKWFRFEIM